MTALLLSCLIAVESGGNARAVGDGGRSIGILQISKGCVDDVNRIYGTRYRWPDDCWDPKKSMAICTLYIHEHAGREAGAERMARTWNGGPSGPKKQSTLRYWYRVKSELSKSR